MHLIYMDDSRDERFCVFSALAVPAARWRTAFAAIRDFRRGLKQSDGIYVHKELHAWKFVSGRGAISDQVVPKGRRCQIFKDALRMLTTIEGVRLFNAVFGPKDDERAFERLVNRINRNMQACDSHALIICDQGKEGPYTRLVRKMGVYNPIPSRYGGWPGAGAMRNIPIERIVEDPVFKPSDRSYFVQMADFCAYALLRREHPLEAKNRYGLHEAFQRLAESEHFLVREASRRDPEGILRP